MNIDYFRRLGLTNADTPDIGELTGSFRRENRAYCTSRECGGAGGRRVPKDVKLTVDYCPDCGAALFWKTIAIGK